MITYARLHSNSMIIGKKTRYRSKSASVKTVKEPKCASKIAVFSAIFAIGIHFCSRLTLCVLHHFFYFLNSHTVKSVVEKPKEEHKSKKRGFVLSKDFDLVFGVKSTIKIIVGNFVHILWYIMLSVFLILVL